MTWTYCRFLLPNDDGEYIAAITNHRGERWSESVRYERGQWSGCAGLTVYAWMPLPDPPDPDA